MLYCAPELPELLVLVCSYTVAMCYVALMLLMQSQGALVSGLK